VENVGLGFMLWYLEFLIIYFDWLSFQHIYRELNVKANTLSKEALVFPKRAFGFYEFVDGKEKEAMGFQL
jgi:hypothetical protein